MQETAHQTVQLALPGRRKVMQEDEIEIGARAQLETAELAVTDDQKVTQTPAAPKASRHT